MSHGLGYTFGELGSAGPPVSSPKFCAASVRRDAAGEALMMCKRWSAIAETPLRYQHFFHHKSKHSLTQAAVKKINSVPTKTSTLI